MGLSNDKSILCYMPYMHLEKEPIKLVNSYAVRLQVLDKCQLLEAVREKEQGLDSLGRKPHCTYDLISGFHFMPLTK